MPKLIDLTGKIFERLTVLGRDFETQKIKNSKEPFWYCQCSCGNKISVRGQDLRQGKIKSCGCLKKENAQKINANNLLNQRFGKLLVLYKCNYLIDNHYVWHCKCDCGNEKDIMGKHLTTGQTLSCGCLKSSGEQKIIEYLTSLNILFEYQKIFKNCQITDTPLRFDFYLPNYNLIIEYNGQQHYKPIDYFGGEERFKQQKINDAFKKDWCIKNNINFLEIPYYYFPELSIEKFKNLIKKASIKK